MDVGVLPAAGAMEEGEAVTGFLLGFLVPFGAVGERS
jgi:hypothetical protein